MDEALVEAVVGEDGVQRVRPEHPFRIQNQQSFRKLSGSDRWHQNEMNDSDSFRGSVGQSWPDRRREEPRRWSGVRQESGYLQSGG